MDNTEHFTNYHLSEGGWHMPDARVRVLYLGHEIIGTVTASRTVKVPGHLGTKVTVRPDEPTVVNGHERPTILIDVWPNGRACWNKGGDLAARQDGIEIL